MFKKKKAFFREKYEERSAGELVVPVLKEKMQRCSPHPSSEKCFH